MQCADINAEKQDIDIIETQLDNVIRSALEKVHNAQLLAGQVGALSLSAGNSLPACGTIRSAVVMGT